MICTAVMAPGKFSLVYMENPPSAEIFKQSELRGGGQFAEGQRRRVKRPSWEECDGLILRIGTKKSLLELKVKVGGIIDDDLNNEETLQNRYQELLKQKKKSSVSARDQYLETVASSILAKGPCSSGSSAGRSTLRLPKKRAVNDLELLKQQLTDLPCLKKPEKDLEHYVNLGGGNVWVRASTVLLEQGLHPRQPGFIFMGLLGRLIPSEIASNRALSRTGKRDTVAIPDQIVAGINVSVLEYCRMHNIEPDYDIKTTVRNFLYYRQNAGELTKRARTEEPQALEDDVHDEPPPRVSNILNHGPQDSDDEVMEEPAKNSVDPDQDKPQNTGEDPREKPHAPANDFIFADVHEEINSDGNFLTPLKQMIVSTSDY